MKTAQSDTGLLDEINADFGEPISYVNDVPNSDVERYEEQMQDYDDAHAEAEVGLHDLSAG